MNFKKIADTSFNEKCSYHCSGPLESYLYTQICPVLANFLILMFLSLQKTAKKVNLRKQHTVPAVSSTPRN